MELQTTPAEATTNQMARPSITTSISKGITIDILGITRTELVHIPHGADSALFGGWGVKI